MTYEKKKRAAFVGESRSLYVVYTSLGILILLAFLFREEGVIKYWLVGVSISLLAIAWMATKYFMSPILCQFCNYDFRATIMQLGKNSNKGYCPKCGKEIV